MLFALSQEFAGDLTETAALLWPARPGEAAPPRLAEVVGALRTTPRGDLPDRLAAWLDVADAPVRRALLGLLTGGLRAEVSGPLARQALAAWGGLDPAAVAEVWHGLAPPYTPLFAWAEGRAPRPDPGDVPLFRPVMRAQPIGAAEAATLDPAAVRAEWRWDGIGVQLAATPSGRRVFSRQGDDLSALLPEVVAAMDFHAVLDGALLALEAPAQAAALRRRLDRPAARAGAPPAGPVGVRLFDLLVEGTEDLRALSFDRRRARLEAWFARAAPAGMELSPLLPVADAADLARRHAAGAPGSAGLMLKRGDSPYLAGRTHGAWRSFKPEPRRIDAVLMYAERSAGAGGGPYADYTFGLWDGDALVPVGKAAPGGTEAERLWLDQWIGAHGIARFGPVREVEKTLVLEVAFESAEAAPRRKSGVALRHPRIVRPRADTPAAEADRLETVLRLVGEGGR